MAGREAEVAGRRAGAEKDHRTRACRGATPEGAEGWGDADEKAGVGGAFREDGDPAPPGEHHRAVRLHDRRQRRGAAGHAGRPGAAADGGHTFAKVSMRTPIL